MAAQSSVDLLARRFRLLALGTAAVLIIVGLLLLSDLGETPRVVITEVGLVAGGLYAAYSCGRRAILSVSRRRRAWVLLAGAGAVAAVGNLLALGSMLVGGEFSGDLAYAFALLLGIGGLISFPTVPRRGTELGRMLLDGVVIGGSLLRIVVSTVFPQLLGTSGAQIFDRMIVIALPMVDVVVATLAALLLVRGSRQDRPTLALVSVGFSLYAISDLAFAVLSVQANFGFGTIIDLGWIAGYAMIALAAWHPATSAATRRDEVGEASPITGTMVTLGLFVIASVVNLTFARGESFSPGMIVLWLLVLAAVVTRQFLVILDLHRLREGLERRVSERTAELRELTETSQLMLSSVGEGIYGVDNHGIVTFTNPAAAATLGYRREELIGQEAHATFHADQDEGTPYPWDQCYVYEAIVDGARVTAEDDVYITASGRRIPVEVTATPLKDGTGGPRGRGAVVVFRDVTQRREVDRLKNEFVSVVSHELRTPLTAIRGSLGLLSGGAVGQLPASADRMVQIALESSERLTRLINDILDIERIESGTMPMNFGDHDAADLLRSGVSQVRAVADQAAVRLEIGTAQGRVRADADRVVQTLINLIGNAIKFSATDGLVVVSAAVAGTDVVFTVTDEGRGIPPEMLDQIFDRFEQVDSTDARLKGGTGLGLSISRTIVERHGGRIWVESDLGTGSMFHFTLPRVVPAQSRSSDDNGPVVLICDDEPEVVEVLSSILAARGYSTIGVTDGDEAVAAARDRRPAAVLLDLTMPGVSGADVVDRLRADPTTHGIPVVVISGVGPASDPQTAARTENWLVKPIDAERLARTVEAAIADHPARGTVLLVEDDDARAETLVTLLQQRGLSAFHARTGQQAIDHFKATACQVLILGQTLPDGNAADMVATLRMAGRLVHVPVVVYNVGSTGSVDGNGPGDLRSRSKSEISRADLEQRVHEILDLTTGRVTDLSPKMET